MVRIFKFQQTVAAAIALVATAISAPRADAQQNLFNVPSGKITNMGELFFQEQFNFSRSIGSSNTTFDLGLGHNFEIGFNALDLNLYQRGGPADGPAQANPDLLFNAQKGFELIDEVWQLGIGAQMGFNPATHPRDVRYQAFAWAINEFKLPEERGSIYAGGYYANVAYGGPGDRFGALLGIEVPIIKERLSFQADYINGNRDISVGVIGCVIYFPSKWQLSLGGQVPAFRSHNPYGFVFELTHPGFSLFKKKEPPKAPEEPL